MLARGITYVKTGPASVGVVSVIVIFLFITALGPIIASWMSGSLLLFLGFLIGSIIFGIGWCTRGAAAILGAFLLTAVFMSTLIILWENWPQAGPLALLFGLIFLANVIWAIFCAVAAIAGAAS